MVEPKFDVIVVGGGSAGCVMAARLSEDPRRTVLLLEAGPDYGSSVAGAWPTELLDASTMPLESHQWGFAGDGAERARVLGGCSSHNACFIVWAAPGDYDRWAGAGNPGWAFADQLVHIRRAETMLGAHLPVNEREPRFVESFLAACDSVGIGRRTDLNGSGAGVGAARIPRNVVDGVRRNAAFAYLDPARGRPNLTIKGESLVDRVVLKGGRSEAVICRDASGERVYEAETVVLSAGAYLTPAILQRSGLGRPAFLESLRVDVAVPLDGVGEHLRDHPIVDMGVPTQAGSNDMADRMPEVLLHARSSLALDADWDSQSLIWQRSDAGRGGPPDLVFSFSCLDSDSDGSVRIRSKDPDALPVLRQPWADLTDHDVQVLREGHDLVQRMCATASFASIIDTRVPVLREAVTPAWIRENVTGYWHPTGTCRMGSSNDPGAVVDAHGRVHGTSGLRVVDASIFPTVPRANTNLPTVAAAEFIASTM